MYGVAGDIAGEMPVEGAWAEKYEFVDEVEDEEDEDGVLLEALAE